MKKSHSNLFNWRGILAVLAALVLICTVMPAVPASAAETTGNYGTATIDGVISEGEYTGTTVVLTAENLKGLKVDWSGAADVPADLRIEVHFMWNEAGLFVGYEVIDNTPWFGAAYVTDQLSFLVDLSPTAEGGSSLKGKTLTDASNPALGGNRAPRFNSSVVRSTSSGDGVFYYLHQLVPAEANLHLVDGFKEICAGKPISKDGTEVGYCGEFMIPWWLLADDMNQKTGEALFNVEEVGKGTVIGEGYEINITPWYINFAPDGSGIGQYVGVTSEGFALEPDVAGISFKLTKPAPVVDPGNPDTGDVSLLPVAAVLCLSMAAIAVVCKRKEQF